MREIRLHHYLLSNPKYWKCFSMQLFSYNMHFKPNGLFRERIGSFLFFNLIYSPLTFQESAEATMPLMRSWETVNGKSMERRKENPKLASLLSVNYQCNLFKSPRSCNAKFSNQFTRPSRTSSSPWQKRSSKLPLHLHRPLTHHSPQPQSPTRSKPFKNSSLAPISAPSTTHLMWRLCLLNPGHCPVGLGCLCAMTWPGAILMINGFREGLMRVPMRFGTGIWLMCSCIFRIVLWLFRLVAGLIRLTSTVSRYVGWRWRVGAGIWR